MAYTSPTSVAMHNRAVAGGSVSRVVIIQLASSLDHDDIYGNTSLLIWLPERVHHILNGHGFPLMPTRICMASRAAWAILDDLTTTETSIPCLPSDFVYLFLSSLLISPSHGMKPTW